jgi:lipoprotein-anchoring transpeptidase ErfK/SrfK
MLVIALALPLVLVVGTIPHQVANAQLTPAQQQALQSLSTTGFTNSQPVSVGGQNFDIKYSIKEGQVVGIVPAPPTTSIDVIIAPTQHAKTPGVFTIQIPRQLLDSKNPDGSDKAFRVTLDGHGLSWKEMQNTNTDRTIGIYFGGSNGFLQIYGTQIA